MKQIHQISLPALKTQQVKNVLINTILLLFIILTVACSNSENSEINPVSETQCRLNPKQILNGNQTFDFIYNSQNQPTQLTTTIPNDKAPWESPVKTTYKIEYNSKGKVSKLSKSIADKLDKYYIIDYNSKDELIKQIEYNAQGITQNYIAAEYENGLIKKITNHNTADGDNIKETTSYEYANGNLSKKIISNLYIDNTKEYHDLEFKYTYYEDKESKIKPLFDGLLGLSFIANIADSKSIQYLPRENFIQLFYTQETGANKNMLKNIEITSNQSQLQGPTIIDYSYEFDNDGYPKDQIGNLKTETFRSEPTQFGVPIIIKSPYAGYFKKSFNSYCD